ncbi:MAG: hypothetical protein H6578_01465 [Chitinophagales bacterium]|nr:hypothetical protein [Chitinophagales bacterium]
MKIYPPIAKRTNKQLFEVIESKEDWIPEVVILAEKELVKRGYSIENQENRRLSKIKMNKRSSNIKANTVFTTKEKIMIIIFSPLLFIFLKDLSLLYIGDGYKKKNKQSLFYSFIGFLFWGLILYISISLS